jgi:hypothetical protein
MAMMDPSWNGQDHSMAPNGEDDFQQFLDMGDMANLGDGLQFDFQGFNAVSHGPAMMHTHSPHDTIDTQMGGTETPSASGPRNGIAIQHQMPPMTSGPAVASIPSQVVPSHRNNTNDAINDIDAQIQFLQHQKLQQQQRQLEEQQRRFEEQQAAFFAQQQRSMVPPTPQSLKIQATNQYYTQQGDQTPHHSTGMFDRYQRMKEQQDVRLFSPLTHKLLSQCAHDSLTDIWIL